LYRAAETGRRNQITDTYTSLTAKEGTDSIPGCAERRIQRDITLWSAQVSY